MIPDCVSFDDCFAMSDLVTGNEIPRLVAHRSIIEASTGKRIVLDRVLVASCKTPFFATFLFGATATVAAGNRKLWLIDAMQKFAMQHKRNNVVSSGHGCRMYFKLFSSEAADVVLQNIAERQPSLQLAKMAAPGIAGAAAAYVTCDFRSWTRSRKLWQQRWKWLKLMWSLLR
jgi:hypothetical protein